MSVAILDVDGTLVDTNYQHALAWFRAFHEHEIVLPVWRLHRHIGMGGDQLVQALTDARVERELGDAIRESETRLYRAMIDEPEPLEGARALIEDLKRREHTVVLASSAKQEELDHYLDLLGARELADDWTSSADVEDTKPAPDLVQVALKKADQPPEHAVMVGDSPFDIQAAKRAGVPTLALMTGGFSRDELLQTGAQEVFESIAELRDALEDGPLR